jgi:hypothetical protein
MDASLCVRADGKPVVRVFDKGAGQAARSLAQLSKTLATGNLGADVAEGVISVGAQGRDGRDAHNDNQGEHDGVLDRGRAVFVLQEVDQVLAELTHGCLSLSVMKVKPEILNETNVYFFGP